MLVGYEVKFDNDAIGARLLESITSGLYDGNLNCLREYVQNSIDSGAKNVRIYFENGNNNLIIKDDGLGMNEMELKHSLGIGITYKTIENVGWRGIGIWSGVPICSKIVIITKKKNSMKLRIEIDNSKLREEYNTNESILNILTKNTGNIEKLELGKGESYNDSQYTIVRLENILPTQKGIFEKNMIEKYLSKNLPVPFNTKYFSFADKINNWLEKRKVFFPVINLKFLNKSIYRPPTKSEIFFEKIIFKEFMVKDELVGVGWFLTANHNIKLTEPNKGIYFKKKGFTLGDENLPLRQYSKSYSQWQYGEIHILSNKIKENAARNNFEYNSNIISSFLEEIGYYIGRLQMMNRYQSSKNILPLIIKAEESYNEENYVAAKKEIKKIKGKINQKPSFPKNQSFNGMKELYDKKFKEGRDHTSKLEEKIRTTQPKITNNKILDKLIENMPSPMKEGIKRVRKKGLSDPNISITDPLRDILKEKTGSKSNEIIELSKKAYGWTDVKGSGKPILTIDPLFTDVNKNNQRTAQRAARNRRFGVMIYTIHDLFVNLYKHEKGMDSMKWFEDLPKDEKKAINTEMIVVVSLIYRLIGSSTKYKSP